MPYVALEWDHRIGHPVIKWLVVKCHSVGRKFGGPLALPPRHDVAYFVEPESAERDAKAFAAYRNRMDEDGGPPHTLGTEEAYSNRHAAFAWDHDIFRPQVKWAVLEWDGENPHGDSVRSDVAYFLDPDSAEADARAFRVIRDALVSEPVAAESVA